MKNVKKIGMALVLALVIVAIVIMTALAAGEYTGSVAVLNTLVEAVGEAETIKDREAAMTAVEDYLVKSPVDPAEEGYDALLVSIKQLRVAMAKEYAAELTATPAPTLSARMTALEFTTKWFNLAYPTAADKNDENYKALYAVITANSISIAKELYSSVDVSLFDVISDDPTTGVNEALTAADNAVKFKQFKNFVKNNIFDKTSDGYKKFVYVSKTDSYLTFDNVYTDMVAKYDAAVEAKYQYHIARAKMNEYGLGLGLDNNFEAGKGALATSSVTAVDKETFEPRNNFSGKETVINDDGTANVVQTLRYMGGVVSAGSTSYQATYLRPSFGASNSGMVIEFSMTTFDHLPSAGIGIQPYSGSAWFEITADGDFGAYEASGKFSIYIENCIVPGEWTRVSVIYKPNDRAKCELYIDYTFVGYFHGDYGNKGTVASELRVGNTASAHGEFSLDNMKCTRGTYFRDDKYLDSMKDYEQFIYYCQYMQDTTLEVPDCITAYESANKLLSNFVVVDLETGAPEIDEVTGEVTFKVLPDTMTNDEKKALENAVESYISFNPQSIIDAFSKQNLEKLVEMVNELTAIIPNHDTETINSRKSQLTAIQTFIDTNANYLWDDGASSIPENERGTMYKDSMDAISEVTLRLSKDTIINKFVATMAAFNDAQSVTLLKSKYAEAEAIYDQLDASLVDEKGYDTFKTHYEVTYPGALAKIYVQTGIANANKFISTVEYILEAYPKQSDWTLYPIVQADLPRWPTGSADIAAFEEKLDELNALNEKYGASVVVAPASWEYSDVKKYNDKYDYDIIPLAVAVTAPDWPDAIDNDFKSVINGINAINVSYGGSIVVAPKNWSAADIAAYNERYEHDLLADGITAERLASLRASYDYVNNYVTMIRSILNSGNCDRSVAGFEIAYARFEGINSHYYAILQADHIANIGDQLERFEATDSYIEKYGILAYIGRYLNDNDVDTESAYMKELISKYDAYSAELDSQKVDYEKVLKQNTTYFINLVNMFDSALTYVDKKAYYDRATEYYYSMNVGTPEAQAAIKRYDAFTLELAVVEDASRGIIEAMMLLPTATTLDDYFKYLVDARICLDNADESIEGVSDAITAFNAAYKAYSDKINSTNANILDCADALGSLRANCGLSAIVSVVIAKLYSF